jgi:hypothetical protein
LTNFFFQVTLTLFCQVEEIFSGETFCQESAWVILPQGSVGVTCRLGSDVEIFLVTCVVNAALVI